MYRVYYSNKCSGLQCGSIDVKADNSEDAIIEAQNSLKEPYNFDYDTESLGD